MANIADKIIVKELFVKIRNSEVLDILPPSTRLLYEKYLDDDIEQLEAEIMLDTVLKFGGKTDE